MATRVGTLPLKPCPAPHTKRPFPWGIGNVESATETKRANAETMQPDQPAMIQKQAHKKQLRPVADLTVCKRLFPE